MRFDTLHKNISKNGLYAKIKELEAHYRLLINKQIDPLLIASGVSGVGKSFLLQKVCHELGVPLMPVVPKNPAALVEVLYRHRDDPILVIDDAKTGFATAPDTAEIIKSAFGPNRMVVWDVKNAGKKGNPPRTFKVHTTLVWLSNYDTSENIDAIAKESRENFKAILSRSGESIHVDASDQDKFRYCIWLATYGEMWKVNRSYISRVAAEKAIEWFQEHRNSIKELSPRTLTFIGESSYKIPDPKDVAMVLKKKLTAEPVRKILGFGPLKLVKAGEWVEDVKSDTTFERA
jgi:hypothetical protein